MNTWKNSVLSEVKNAILTCENGSRPHLQRNHLLCSGWCTTVNLTWDFISKQQNYITAFLSWEGISVANDRCTLEAQTLLDNFDDDILINEIMPECQEWFQAKVSSEYYGGLYSDTVSVYCNFYTYSPAFVNHKFDFTVVAQDRLNMLYQNIRQLINEGLNTIELDGMYPVIDRLVHTTFNQLRHDVGTEKATESIATLMRRCEQEYKKHEYFAFMRALYTYASNCIDQINTLDEDEKDIIRFCGVNLMLTQHENSKEKGNILLSTLADSGCDKTKRLLLEGTGNIPAKNLHSEDENVICYANDLLHTVSLQILQENCDAYTYIVAFLIQLLNANFPYDYNLIFYSTAKNYLPFPPTYHTDENSFWCNCAEYPRLAILIKKYVRLLLDEKNKPGLSPADKRHIVTHAAFPAFALALSDASNFDIVSELMADKSTSGLGIADYFTNELIKRYGISPYTIPVIIDCLLSINGSNFDWKSLQDMTAPENAAAVLEYCKTKQLNEPLAKFLGKLLNTAIGTV